MCDNLGHPDGLKIGRTPLGSQFTETCSSQGAPLLVCPEHVLLPAGRRAFKDMAQPVSHLSAVGSKLWAAVAPNSGLTCSDFLYFLDLGLGIPPYFVRCLMFRENVFILSYFISF